MVPILALGQAPGALSGPMLGYVLDSSAGTLRPIVGIAGSATVGAAVDLGFTITQAVNLPDQRNVIVVPSTDGDLLSLDMGMTPPVSHPIKGSTILVSEISVSPHGTAAVLSYPSSQLVRVVTGLPNNPVIAFEISTTEVAPILRRVVVNDDASALMFSFAEGERETVYRWNRTEGYRLLTSTAEVGALAFTGDADVLFADSITNQVFLAHDVKRQSVVTFLAGSAGGVSRPIGAGLSSRNEIFVANAGSNAVMTFDASGRMLRTQHCDCRVSGLILLGLGAYRLTDRLNQTIYVLDGSTIENRILFIPPIQ
jgi:hypothetical protein